MKKLTSLSALGLLLTLTVAGCSQSAPEPEPTPSSDVEAERTATESKAMEDATDDAVEVTVTLPAVKAEDGTETEPATVIWSSVTSVQPLTAEQLLEIQEAASPDQMNSIKAYDLYRVAVSEAYVSGADPKGEAASGNYKAVVEGGSGLQSVSAIGFDWCESGIYPEGFLTGDANTFCLVTAVAKGEPAPVGVRFQQPESQYDSETGKPVVILAKKG